MLMEKSDGTYWLAIWNEARLSGPKSSADISVADHTVTLNLASTAGEVTVYDPMTGTSAVQSVANAQTVSVSVPDHPILVEINGTGATAAAPAVPTAAQENQISLLYEGALGRAASSAEVGYWSGILANDISAADQAQGAIHSLAMISGGYNGSLTVADGFLMSAEFQSKYSGLDNTGFVTQIYENALHRAPEAGATQYWDHLIDTGTSRAVVLVAIAESPEAMHVNAGLLAS